MKNEDIVLTLVEWQTQLRICHWQTRSFAQHKAFGGAYDAFDGIIDRFVEALIGIAERPTFDDPIEIRNYYELQTDIIGWVNEFRAFLVSFDTELALPQSDTDLLNIRDEMLGEVDKLRYLLTLD